MFFCLMIRRPLRSTLFPYSTPFRSDDVEVRGVDALALAGPLDGARGLALQRRVGPGHDAVGADLRDRGDPQLGGLDRKSTRLNSSHANISYAVFCLKKKHTYNTHPT